VTDAAIDGSFAHGLVGVTLDGRYRLDAVLGEGGMGSVFRATQLAMDRKVAVKLLKPHLTGDQAALERFAREARTTRKVDSPHAVKILDFGVTPLGDYYMVLEYLDGRTVQRELEIDGPFAPARVAHIARQALHALGAAHAQGLIHRDVKPDNLLLMRVGADGDYTKVLDFGVAKLMQGAAGDPAQLALTAAGTVFGTPEFMSPEQACGQPLDGRSDLYSLAATMFVMLTGTGLFEGNTAIEWLTHHARTPAPMLAMVRPELAAYPGLDEVLQRCLAKHPGQRPATAAEMARQLAELEPALARRTAHPSRRIASKPTPSRASSYVEVLRDISPASSTAAIPAPGPAALARADTMAPEAAAVVPGPSSTATTGVRAIPPARRRLSLWLIGISTASLVGVAVGLSVRGSDAPPTAASPAPLPVAVAASAAVRSDAGARETGAPAAAPPDAAAPSAAGGTSAVVAVASHPARPPVRVAAPPRNPAAEEHLRAAEDALRGANTLRQLAEADLALRADPRSARARYLLGDALIKSGDLDHGCNYLAAIKHVAGARARARAAGCPSD
jgi:serine/threonine protein kinase